jgi:hypothetical protein
VTDRRSTLTPAGYHDLLGFLKNTGCPVCHAENRGARRYLDSLFWESVTDGPIRARVRAAHGFCREHAALLVELLGSNDALGIAIVYRDVLKHLRAEAIAAASSEHANRRWWQRKPDPLRLRPHLKCSACESTGEMSSMYLALLARTEPDSELGRAARQPSRGLCIAHLDHGLSISASEEERDCLLDIYLQTHDELIEDLSEYIRKQDYRFRSEGLTEQQASSWRRAVSRVVGEP